MVAGVSIGVAKGVFQYGEASQAAQTPVLAAKKIGKAAPGQPARHPVNRKTAMALMEEAAKANKYLFGFFWKSESEQTNAMKKVFEVAIAKVSERASAAVVQVTDPAEREIVKKFGLEPASMPLALAIAPNGAIMGGFPTRSRKKRCSMPSVHPSRKSA